MDKKSHGCETPNEGSTEFAQTDDPKKVLKNLRLKNVNRMICAQLNINSIRNKFNSLVDITNNNIDILMISETKLDPSFPNGQFHIHGFSEPQGLIEMVRVVEYFCKFVKIYLQN